MTGPLWVYSSTLTDPYNGITTSFSEGVLDVSGSRSVVLSGIASSPVGVKSVDIIDYTIKSGVVVLGSADLADDGSWTFNDVVPEHSSQSLGVRVTDNSGNESQPPLGTTLEADDPRDGLLTQYINVNTRSQGFTQNNIYDDSRLLYRNYDNYRSSNPSLFIGNGHEVPFYIYDGSHNGKSKITNFFVSGPQHDTLNLTGFGFHSLVDILQHTSNVNGSAVIHNDLGHTLTLEGVTKTQLAHNKRDFSFKFA